MSVVGSNGAAAGFRAFADYFDGCHAVVRRAEVTIDDGPDSGLSIDAPDGVSAVWPLASLRALRDQAGGDQLVLTSTTAPLARLVVTDPAVRAVVAARARGLGRRAPVRGWGRIAAASLAAIASVGLIVFVLIPLLADNLATRLPPAGERALGDVTLGQVRRILAEGDGALATCEKPSGRAALAEMKRRLMAGERLPVEVTLTVLDDDLVNAFALPGGHVVLFRGLIDAAEGPDEVAAVLAHELGHVAARDPVRLALRSAGSIGIIGLVFGDFAGGAVVLFLVERLVQADYSQSAEAAADRYAFERLRAAGLPPAALGRMFARLRDEYGDADGLAAHFLTHPSLGDRIRAAEAAPPPETPGGPVLDAEAWSALRDICGR